MLPRIAQISGCFLLVGIIPGDPLYAILQRCEQEIQHGGLIALALERLNLDLLVSGEEVELLVERLGCRDRIAQCIGNTFAACGASVPSKAEKPARSMTARPKVSGREVRHARELRERSPGASFSVVAGSFASRSM